MLDKVEVVDWLDYDKKDHVISWVILESMTALGIEKFNDFDSSAITIDFKINGIRVPFVPIMEFLNSQLDDLYNQARKEAKSDAISEVMELLNNHEFKSE